MGRLGDHPNIVTIHDVGDNASSDPGQGPGKARHRVRYPRVERAPVHLRHCLLQRVVDVDETGRNEPTEPCCAAARPAALTASVAGMWAMTDAETRLIRSRSTGGAVLSNRRATLAIAGLRSLAAGH